MWQQLAQQIFFNKDYRLLKYQYMNILKSSKRVQWTTQQDQLLREAYNNYPKGEWNEVAKQLFFRSNGGSQQFKSPKHCRERWNNHLNVQVKKQKWSQDEDLEMMLLIREKGKKWSQIAKQLGQRRTQHQIKNRYNSLIAQLSRHERQQEQSSALRSLIESYQQKRQSSKFTFFNNIIVLKQQQQTTQKSQLTTTQQQSHLVSSQQPLSIKPDIQFSSNMQEEKRENTTVKGMTLVYCGNKSDLLLDKPITAAIEDKLFASTFLSEIKSDNSWLDRSIVHTPGHHFFEDSTLYDKRMGNFKLSQKGSIQKSDIAASMEFTKLLRSDLSLDYKILSSSTSDIRSIVKYQFSNDIKEM